VKDGSYMWKFKLQREEIPEKPESADN